MCPSAPHPRCELALIYHKPSCVDDAEFSPIVLCARSWSSIPSSPTSYTVNVGDKLQFSYNAAHNVYLMASESAYDTCDFAGATELGGVSHGVGIGRSRLRSSEHTS